LSEIKLFRIDYDRVIEKLKEFAKRKINENNNILAIILVGSLARGDYTAFSDADLVVVVKEDDRRFLDRITEFIDPTLGIDVDPMVYTLSEIKEMAVLKYASTRIFKYYLHLYLFLMHYAKTIQGL